MDTLGIYIFNQTRNQWLVDWTPSSSRWGTMTDAHEFPAGTETEAEKVRESVSGDDVTFTMAALH